MNDKLRTPLQEEIAAVAARRGLRKLARELSSGGPPLSHASLSRFASGSDGLSDNLALAVELALGHPEGSFVETRRALLREALADPVLHDDPTLVDLLYREMRRYLALRDT